MSAHPSLEVQPGVVDLVNPALKAHQGEAVYSSVSDPGKHGSEAATTPKDWTIHRPAPEKVEDPPPKPLYQVLMEHIKNMWTASASAVQLEQVNGHLSPPVHALPADAPGTVAKEVLVYDHNTIKKNERV